MQSCQQNKTPSLNKGIPRFMKSLLCTRFHLQQTKNKRAIIRIGMATGEKQGRVQVRFISPGSQNFVTSEGACIKKGRLHLKRDGIR